MTAMKRTFTLIPILLLVVGPQHRRVFQKTVNVTIGKESPFALLTFAQDVVVDGPLGRYRFLASFERGRGGDQGIAGLLVGADAGRPELIFSNTAHGIMAVDPAAGEVTWQFGRPFLDRAVISPVVAPGQIREPSRFLGVG
jgi:hypothetical protein